MPRPATAEKKTPTIETPEATETVAPVQKTRKTRTDWKVLYNSKLTPTTIECREYPPVNYSLVACHSRLPLTAQSMKDHLDAEHGGSYFITLTQKDTPWKGWLDLQDMGVELADFRCNVCLQEIPLSGASLSKHMKPHLNGNRRIQKGDTFRLTLTMSLDDVNFTEDE